MYRKILVPVDGSEAATRGLNEAIRLTQDQGSQIRLVHVVNEWIVVSPDVAGANVGRVIEILRANGETVLDQAASLTRAANIEADTVLFEAMGGQAGAAIVEQAQEWGADLIVCGTHGRRGIRRLVLGSDAEYIVRHASVPVLLVRSVEAARE